MKIYITVLSYCFLGLLCLSITSCNSEEAEKEKLKTKILKDLTTTLDDAWATPLTIQSPFQEFSGKATKAKLKFDGNSLNVNKQYTYFSNLDNYMLNRPEWVTELGSLSNVSFSAQGETPIIKAEWKGTDGLTTGDFIIKPIFSGETANHFYYELRGGSNWSVYGYKKLSIDKFNRLLKDLNEVCGIENRNETQVDDNDVNEDGKIESYFDSFPSEDVTVSASSNIAPSAGLSYDSQMAVDGDLKTWWSPKGSTGHWLELRLEDSQMVSGIRIHAGSHYPSFTSSSGKHYGNLYTKNYRIRTAKILFSDGTSEVIKLEDIDEIQEVRFERSRNISWLKVYPQELYETTLWKDVCISEIELVK